jgi:hypothetical protein
MNVILLVIQRKYAAKLRKKLVQ